MRVRFVVYAAALLTFAFAALPLVISDQTNMVQLHVDSFTVVGVEVRTSNAREASNEGAIGKLWARLHTEDFVSRIQNRADSRIVALYTDYESGKDGAYTYVLGAKVSSVNDIPPGMVSRKVESGTYAVFSEKGRPPAQMTPDVWKQIWSLENTKQLQRAYKTDFEVHYGGSANDPTKAHVDIYIGLKTAQ